MFSASSATIEEFEESMAINVDFSSLLVSSGQLLTVHDNDYDGYNVSGLMDFEVDNKAFKVLDPLKWNRDDKKRSYEYAPRIALSAEKHLEATDQPLTFNLIAKLRHSLGLDERNKKKHVLLNMIHRIANNL